MNNAIKEIGKIRDSIISGKMPEKKLKETMIKMKEEYGEDVFKPYDLNSIRQYVYTKPYYERLVQLAKNGASSQEFFIHLIRVRDGLKKQNKIMVLISIVSCIFICISIFSIVIGLENNKILKKILINESTESSINGKTLEVQVFEEKNVTESEIFEIETENTTEQSKQGDEN